jgi:hypothetical protein
VVLMGRTWFDMALAMGFLHARDEADGNSEEDTLHTEIW